MATKTWSSTAASTSFTTASNWVGGVAPVAGDDVVIVTGTNNPTISTITSVALRSVTINSGTLTVNAALNVTNTGLGDLTLAGGTIAGSADINVFGSLSVSSGSTWSNTGTLTFTSTATGKTINTNGKTLSSPIVFNGSGGVWTLNNNVTTTGTITHTAGGLVLNNYILSGTTFTASGTTSRTLNFSTSGAIECTQQTTSTVFSIASATTTQYAVSGTPLIRITGVSGTAATRTVSFGSSNTWATTAFKFYVDCGSTSTVAVSTTLAANTTILYGDITVVSGKLTLTPSLTTPYGIEFANLDLAGCSGFTIPASTAFAQIQVTGNFVTPQSGNTITGLKSFSVTGNATINCPLTTCSATNVTLNSASGSTTLTLGTGAVGQYITAYGDLTLGGSVAVLGTLDVRGNITLSAYNISSYQFTWTVGSTAKYYSSTGGSITVSPPANTATIGGLSYNCYLDGQWEIATGTTAKTINIVQPTGNTYQNGVAIGTNSTTLLSHTTLFDLNISGGDSQTYTTFVDTVYFGCTCSTTYYNYWNNLTFQSGFASNSVTGYYLNLSGNYTDNSTSGTIQPSIYLVGTSRQTFYTAKSNSYRKAPYLVFISSSKMLLASNFMCSINYSQTALAADIDFNSYTLGITEGLWVSSTSNFSRASTIEFFGSSNTSTSGINSSGSSLDFTGITIKNSVPTANSGLLIYAATSPNFHQFATLTNSTYSPITFGSNGLYKFTSFAVKGVSGNLVQIKSNSTGNTATLEKATAWNVGANSVSTVGNTGITLAASTAPEDIDYLNFSYITATVTAANKFFLFF